MTVASCALYLKVSGVSLSRSDAHDARTVPTNDKICAGRCLGLSDPPQPTAPTPTAPATVRTAIRGMPDNLTDGQRSNLITADRYTQRFMDHREVTQAEALMR